MYIMFGSMINITVEHLVIYVEYTYSVVLPIYLENMFNIAYRLGNKCFCFFPEKLIS